MPAPPRATAPRALAWRLVPVLLAAAAAAVALPALATPRPTGADLQALGDQVSRLDEDLNVARDQLVPLRAAARQAADQVARERTVLARLRAKVALRAAAVYEGGAVDPLVELLGAGDSAGVAERAEMLDLLARYDGDAIAAAAAEAQVFQAAVAEAARQQALQAGQVAGIARRQAELRARYAELVALANRLATPSQVPIPADLPPAPTAAASQAVHVALAQIGKPYRWAAAGPGAFDCSGLTMYAWGKAGVALPHSASEQYAAVQHVDLAGVAPGDLVFFGSPIHHVGLYIGAGLMVAAPSTGREVQVQPIDRGAYAGAGRPA